MGRISFQTARDVDDLLRRAARREGTRVGPYCREASIYRAAYGIPYYELQDIEARVAVVEELLGIRRTAGIQQRLAVIERTLGITPVRCPRSAGLSPRAAPRGRERGGPGR